MTLTTEEKKAIIAEVFKTLQSIKAKFVLAVRFKIDEESFGQTLAVGCNMETAFELMHELHVSMETQAIAMMEEKKSELIP